MPGKRKGEKGWRTIQKILPYRKERGEGRRKWGS